MGITAKDLFTLIKSEYKKLTSKTHTKSELQNIRQIKETDIACLAKSGSLLKLDSRIISTTGDKMMRLFPWPRANHGKAWGSPFIRMSNIMRKLNNHNYNEMTVVTHNDNYAIKENNKILHLNFFLMRLN